LELHWTRGHAKLVVGLGRGKQAPDKRADIKKRETDRELRRALAHRGR
jgi:SsrA-binding protein